LETQVNEKEALKGGFSIIIMMANKWAVHIREERQKIQLIITTLTWLWPLTWTFIFSLSLTHSCLL